MTRPCCPEALTEATGLLNFPILRIGYLYDKRFYGINKQFSEGQLSVFLLLSHVFACCAVLLAVGKSGNKKTYERILKREPKLFLPLQSYDNNTAYFIFNKENIAEMFIGYALMLFEGGIAPDVTDEALNAYKKAFTEAFDYYSVEFIINRAK